MQFFTKKETSGNFIFSWRFFIPDPQVRFMFKKTQGTSVIPCVFSMQNQTVRADWTPAYRPAVQDLP